MDNPPPAVQMIQLLAGFQVSQALYVVAELGVPDRLLDGPRTSAELAADLQADPAALDRLLRALASLGVFTEQEQGRFAVTPLGRTLASDEPGSVRGLARMWMQTHYAPFGGLLETVRTGQCAATRHYGKPFFAWLGEHPEHVERFSTAMGNLTESIKLGAVDSYAFTGVSKIVDVGGADGTLLAHVLRRLPQASGIVYDLPHVIDAAEPTIKGFALGDRLTAEAGDFFEHVPAGGDCYLTAMILHDWDDESVVHILSRIREAAAPGAAVRCVEFVLPEGDEPHMAKMIDLTMLGMLTGRERRTDEFAALFGRAGLRFEGIAHSPTPMSVVEARVP
jgi:hypothetical protein